ncbi:IgGFc-binding protein-like [Scyliorhinus canicula]|uniref:IgGFc-binding protein-like n=1 Tax=Scyliorhinus canicula TaxID=7830 RepID=UPI0018F3E89C|nr:IgGFc-binding protein-like [Scyliorhinus canicula]
MENFQHEYKQKAKFELLINSYEVSTKVTVKLKNVPGFGKELLLGKGVTALVEVPLESELRGSEQGYKTVLITSDKDISVSTFNTKLLTADAAVIYPISSLGTEYYIFTPDLAYSGLRKEFAITNTEQQNSVSITLTGKVFFQGHMYQKGSTMKVSLKAYESAQFQSTDNLTGSRVLGIHPLAVLSGHKCSMSSYKCNHVYEQLPSVDQWGTDYLVAPTSVQKRHDYVYVLASQPTQLHVSCDHMPRHLEAGKAAEYRVYPNKPITISATKGILVLYYFPGLCIDRSKGYDPFLMTIRPTNQFASSYITRGLRDFSNFISIVAKSSETGHVLLDNHKLKGTKSWQAIGDSGYSWIDVSVGKGDERHEVRVTSGSGMAVYKYGVAQMNAYGCQGNEQTAGGPTPDPCSRTKCRIKEHCHVVDGIAVCQPLSSAVCWAWGDPHYHTFDALNFDFQGTCTYTIAKKCGADTSLRAFNINAKNDNRGNTRVAYVMLVNIEVYGTTITVFKHEYGQVRVNGIRTNLPLTLQEGNIEVYQSGAYVILETDFQLKVTYDWNHHLVVKISSSYFGSVCGLCGNYDGHPQNDFQTPQGNTVSKALDFGKSWKVNDGDIFCWDNCNGVCPTCDPDSRQRYGSPSVCGLIKMANGPFRDCHAKIDPQHYVDSCIYDVCLSKGLQSLLCQAMKAYAEVCQREGVKIYDWRTPSRCPLPCPENSHYEACGTACPATCTNPLAPKDCQRACVESCVCNNGHVLSAGKCVAAQSCGCSYQGLYYKAGETFWGDASCQSRCRCDPNRKKVECKSQRCRNKEECKLVNGVMGCHPVGYGTCTAAGDPHYRTFDGRKYDFQGTCVYKFSSLCANNTDLQPFDVQVQNEHRGSRVVSYTRLAWIVVYGQTIVLTRDYVGKVLVNGILVNLPYALEDEKIIIYKSCRGATLETDFGLRVTYDWRSRISVTLPSTYSNSVCGLCGNFDGKRDNDLTTKDGKSTNNPTTFGKSWQVDSTPGCSHDCRGKCPQCDIVAKRRYESSEFCGKIKDDKGPFRDCLSHVDPNEYFNDCLFDSCLYEGHRTVVCEAVAAYAAACQDAGITINQWRSKSFCPMSCPANSHYEVCGTGCPVSCATLSKSDGCKASCAEGCQCDEGFVLSGEQCVPLAQCGCLYQGAYYKSGQTFYPNGKCAQRCSCEDGGVVRCHEVKCGVHEKCKLVNGVMGCHPVGHGTCTAAGDPHYRTFDGRKYDFQGTCVYKFSSLCANNTDLQPFDVQVQNEHRGSRVVSYTRLAWIVVYGQTIVLTRDYVGKVLVNGILVNLPYALEDEKIIIYKSCRGATLETEFGLRVTYDWRSRISVTLPSTYSDSVCGLCGNFDGKRDNDLTTKDGKSTNNPTTFGKSWQVDSTPGCSHDCRGKCPQCDIVAKRRYESSEFCGKIKDDKGPFRDCLSHVDPKEYFNDCLFDSCLYEGHRTVVCEAVAAYAAACQDAGITINQWRSKSFCPMLCPANSHYEVCGIGCPVTCATLSEPEGCSASCAEGCQCDEGFVLSGEQCVPLAQCGCLYQGAYYTSGQTFYPNGKCGQRCSCEDGGVVRCREVKCGAHEVCKVVNGERGCHAVGVGTCTASGDPHYRTFDGRKYDFQGTCTYTLVTVYEKEENLPKFTVNVENESFGSGKVAVTRLVEVKVHGYSLILEQKVRWKVKVNGILTNLPLSLDNGRIRSYQHGHKAVIETDFGLMVSYDLTYYVTVTVPGNYFEKVRGLCGNFNGKGEKEFTLHDGQLTKDVTEFGKSWRVPVEGAKCNSGCGKNCPVCEPKRRAILEKKNYCGFLTMAGSPLEACHSLIDPKQFFLDCLYDACQSNGDPKIVCDSIQAYVEACQAGKVNLHPWRSDSFCPMKCPANSHYELCADTCATTCAGISDVSKCPQTCSEGCQCDDGFFADGERCVSMVKCGCFGNGRYYQPGEVVIQKDCKEKCTCSLVGLYCEEMACTSEEKCQVKHGVLGCHNKDPCKDAKCRVKETCKIENGEAKCVPQYNGKCWAWGDPHYHTFDLLNFNFQGTCTYIISETCGSDHSLTPFRIEAKNDIRGNTAVSYVKIVHINVYGYKISIYKSEIGKVRVDDIRTSLPVTLVDGKLRVFQSGAYAVLETDFGLMVFYDWNWYLIVEIPSSYFGNLCGLCGNFNGKKSDDKLFPNGTSVSSVVQWAGSWKVNDRDPFCWDYCRGYCPTCSDEHQNLYKSQTYCGRLEELFKDCHEKVDHRPFFDSCVYDVCLNQGRKSMLCQALAAYATECQKEGITVKNWRKAASCRKYQLWIPRWVWKDNLLLLLNLRPLFLLGVEFWITSLPWMVITWLLCVPQVDGELFNLPFQLRCKSVKVVQEANKIVLSTKFGLRVTYDTVYFVAVVVPSTYKGKLGGLCGNYKGEKKDKFTLPNGKTTKDVTVFGSSWKVFVRGMQCDDGCGDQCPKCEAGKASVYKQGKACGLLREANGPFAACAKVIDPGTFIENCVYDLCEADGQTEVLCNSLQAYAIACQAAGVQIKSWRNKNFCPLSCPVNSHYELCADTCEATCSEIIAPGGCDGTCSEGCQCDAGYVFSGNVCVPMETCGCINEGRYFQAGETIFTRNCVEKCTCYLTGAVICEKVTCPASEICDLRNGVRGCYSKRGVCSIMGGQKLDTFNGKAAEVQAPGIYEVAAICDQHSAEWFRALVEFKVCSKHGKLGAVAIYVYFEGAFIAVTEEKTIWVNGHQVKQDQLPFKATSKVTIRVEQGAVIVQHSAKVELIFRGFGDFTVTLADTFRNQLCGACGKFDGSSNGELRMPDGKVTTDIQQYFRAWLAKEFSSCSI